MKKRQPKPAPEPSTEMAAPAVLRHLQKDAAKFAREVEELEDRLAALRSLSPNAAEKEENKAQLNRVDLELSIARKNFRDTAKTLLDYDKNVVTERREGEKVSVSECREWFAQYRLTIHVARENYIISIAQASPKFTAPEDFVKAHAEIIRSTEETALASAVKEGALPDWILK